ncbi:MAG TPA: class I SAM-dependent methyltransferase [Lentisphaeria bacterium]|nr:class I SAM-dependent methyltransferase [Lentisphaeria bacterium]
MLNLPDWIYMIASEYSRMAELEDQHWWYRALRRRVLKALCAAVGDASAPRVLDAGCGSGGMLKAVGTVLPQTDRVGLDFMQEALESSCNRAQSALLGGSVNALPLRSESFNAVISTDVIYHRDVSDAAAVQEFQRVLRPGGTLILTVAAFESLRGQHDVAVHTARRYRREQIVALLEQAGFLQVRARYSFHWLFLPLFLSRRLSSASSEAAPDEQSDVGRGPRWLNAVLFAVCGLDDWISRWLPVPFGTSVFATATAGPAQDGS